MSPPHCLSDGAEPAERQILAESDCRRTRADMIGNEIETDRLAIRLEEVT